LKKNSENGLLGVFSRK